MFFIIPESIKWVHICNIWKRLIHVAISPGQDALKALNHMMLRFRSLFLYIPYNCLSLERNDRISSCCSRLYYVMIYQQNILFSTRLCQQQQSCYIWDFYHIIGWFKYENSDPHGRSIIERDLHPSKSQVFETVIWFWWALLRFNQRHNGWFGCVVYLHYSRR